MQCMVSNNPPPHHTTQTLCKTFKCTLQVLLRTFIGRAEKWTLHLSILLFAYNAMSHSTSGFQPYEVVFGCKAPTVCNACLVWQIKVTNICKVSVHRSTNSIASYLV